MGIYYRCNILLFSIIHTPIPVAARSKARDCGRSPAEIVDTIPPEAWMSSVVSVVGCQVEVSASG